MGKAAPEDFSAFSPLLGRDFSVSEERYGNGIIKNLPELTEWTGSVYLENVSICKYVYRHSMKGCPAMGEHGGRESPAGDIRPGLRNWILGGMAYIAMK